VCNVCSVRALGDKSELPLLKPTPFLSVDTDTQDFDVESELSDLAIGPVVNAEDNAGSTSDMISSDAECVNVMVDATSPLEPVADTDDATVELCTSDVVASHSNCEAEADLLTEHVTVGSDSKGEMELHRDSKKF